MCAREGSPDVLLAEGCQAVWGHGGTRLCCQAFCPEGFLPPKDTTTRFAELGLAPGQRTRGQSRAEEM